MSAILRGLVTSILVSGMVSSAASAQTALRLGTNDLFKANSAILTSKGQAFLEEYMDRQKCKNFNIIGYAAEANSGGLVGQRARVIRGLAQRYEASATVKLEPADAEALAERRVEVFPEGCVAFGAAGNSGLPAIVPAGLAAVLILGVVGGGTSTPHTN